MKSRSTTRWRAFGIATVLLVGVAACGGDDDDTGTTTGGGDATTTPEVTSAPDDTTDDTTGGSGVPQTTSAPQTTPAAGSGTQGGDVVFAASAETASLDPLDHNRASTASFPLHMFYDSLAEFTPEGETVPFLAESIEPNDDKTVWTVKLRPGIQFHDGTPLNADAVVYNFQRFQNDERAAATYGVRLVSSITAIDDLTVEYALTEPWGAFPAMLALTPGFIASPTAIEEMGRDAFALEGGVGTGPFVLEERTIDSRTVGVRNENYWRDGEPYLDSFTFQPITDSETRYASILSGDVDIVQTNIGRQLADAESQDGLGVATLQGNGGPSIVFNLREAPVDDVRVRRALALAIDRDALDEVLYDGTMVRTCGPFTSDSVWYTETECYDYDPDAARELIDEYEAETGTDVVIDFLCSTSAGLPEQTDLMVGFWEEIGVDVEVDQVDPAQLLDRTRADPPGFQTLCWFGDFNTDPDERLRIFYDSEESGAKRDGYSNPEVDAAFDEGRAAATFEERYAAYAKVQELLAEDLPHIYWTTRLDGAVFDDRVKGVVIVPGGGFWPGRIWVES
jgi:peptide/nickel transport system substrate-binding protein